MPATTESLSASATFTTGNRIPTLAEMQQTIQTKPWIPSQVPEGEDLPSEEEVLRFIPFRIDTEMHTGRQEVEEEWDDAKEIYEAYIPSGDAARKNLRPNIKIPWSAAITEAALSEEVDAFPGIEIDTQEDDDKIKVPILDSCVKYVLDRTGWDKLKIRALRLRRIFGVCVMRISYVRTNRWIHERIPVKDDDGALAIGFKKILDHEWDDIKFDIIDDLNNFYMDETALDISEATDCALITYLTWPQMRNLFQNDNRYKNIEFVFPGAEYSCGMDTGKLVYPEPGSISYSKKVKMVEYWDKDRDWYITMLNNIPVRITHMVDDHKQLPFAMLHMYRRPTSAWSKGLPKLIESIEAAYNAIIGAELQATKLAFPVITTEEDSGIDPKAKATYPGVVFEGAMGKMKLEKLGSVPAEAYQLKAKLEELLIYISRINYKNVYESTSDRVGIEALKKESMISGITLNLRENEADFVVRMGNLVIKNVMQYFKTPKVRALVGPEEAKALADSTLDKEGKKLVYDMTEKEAKRYNKTRTAIGVMEYRKIPVNFDLKPTEEKGIFNLAPLGNGERGSILARPEYIRCKSQMEVRAVRPSAMGSSKEARKLMLMEFSNHAQAVNKQLKELGLPQIYEMFPIEQQIQEAFEMPKKILSKQDKSNELDARSHFKKIAAPFMNTAPSVQRQQSAALMQQQGMQGAMPEQQQDPNSPELSPEEQQQFASLTT